MLAASDLLRQVGEEFGAQRPDPAAYMLMAAQTSSAVAYKAYVVRQLELAGALATADIGCGPATDLAAVRGEVGDAGTVFGLDVEPRMLSAARERVASEVGVHLLAADAHALPLPAESLDRVRIDRSLQHMANPKRVLAEIRRVLRADGRAVVAEPDWGTFVIDTGRESVSRVFVDYTCREVVRNASIGRQVARVGDQAGLTVTDVAGFPTVLRDFTTADQIFGLTRNAREASRSGHLAADDAARWLQELRDGPMLAAVTLFVTTLTVPKS